MNKPTLSVCLLTYNQAAYIKEAVDTILMQKVNFEWEFIIADDYSTDGTRQILEAYQKQHPALIRLILQKKNLGPVHNWLALMSAPTGKYVLYADGDDYFTDPTKLQRQVDFLEANKDCSICFHPVRVTYEDGSHADELFPTPTQRFDKEVFELKDLLVNNFIQTNSAVYRWRYTKEDITKVIPLDIAPGDWFLHILHAEVGRVGFINRTMSVYRKHPGGLWFDSNNNKDEFWKKHGLAWLRFYVKLLAMFGENPDYQPILASSIINLLNSMDQVDKKYHDTLFIQAISALPAAAEIYIDNLREQVTQLHNHSDEQAKVIQHYVDLSEKQARQLTTLNSLRSVRFQRTIDKHIRRKKV